MRGRRHGRGEDGGGRTLARLRAAPRSAWRRLGHAATYNRPVRAVRAAGVVERRLPFVAAEAMRRDGTARAWALREGGVAVLRSGGRDLDILEEVFVRRLYDLPAELEALLPQEGAHVVDLGANVGLFGVRMLQRLPGVRIDAFEPDPINLALLERCRVASGAAERWQVHPVAAAAASRVVSFQAGGQADSRIARPGVHEGVIEVQAVDVFEHLASADFLKMDIEGAEWEILADPRFASVRAPVVALEFHGHLRPRPDIRSAVDALMAQAGYRTRHILWLPFGVGQLWAWRGGA